MAEKSNRAEKEEQILQFWKENQIFEKTLEKESPKGEFVFYDGPPFATGLPHAGSLLSSVTKDVIPRYKTMQGFHVRRRWGWDCHGLPIENMIEKELGLKDKTEIEGKIGIKAFNEACRASVLRYAHEWKKYVDRVGRWVEYDNAYKTMDNTFIESVWHALKKINEKGLLYEGKKVLLYCPHCETPIAKAEIAMDNSYKDVTEESVYIKFKIKDFPNAYFLAWTTTPWTLPGNVALAVGADIDYVEAKVGNEILVLAKERLSVLNQPYEIVAEHKGKEMVGMEYEPLYEIFSVQNSGKKGFYVAEADFVTTTDGTGLVHTAVIYGEDDYNLGLKLDLPMVQLLDSAGHFNDKAPEFIEGQYFKKAEKMVKEDLEKRGLIFKREQNTHSYPHCHRCGTALLYNALSSWFINIQKIKGRMIELNEKVNWIPEHLKHGRFLNIMENAPDWTISRNRYWASPLPIWKDADGKLTIVGSVEELKKLTTKSGNTYTVMRHGETVGNTKKVWRGNPLTPDSLTEQGRAQVKASAATLKGMNFDFVFISQFERASETAGIVLTELGLSQDKLVVDPRLGEWNAGSEFELKPLEQFFTVVEAQTDKYNFKTSDGESFSEVVKRVGTFLYELESKYKDKNILIITHGGVMRGASLVSKGFTFEAIPKKLVDLGAKNAEVRRLDFVPLPHNDDFELDLHRPYIDEIELVSEEGKPLKRIPEVIDGWVESASMPFAEYHYPFENKEAFESRFPGDFVAEYIAQTRTWFYYMHTMAVALFDNVSFKNVISTGNVQAKDGSKMSKSKGNYTDPLVLIDSVGADAFRYYLMSSVVMQSEDMLFKDEEVKDVHNRLINILANSLTFYELYADGTSTEAGLKSTHALDKWILSRLNVVIKEVTEALDVYDMVRASRPLKEFVSDLSTWYIRRSRDRFKGDDLEDKKFALGMTRHVFKEFSKLIAPIMPFVAEEIYGKVKEVGDPESVHLADWPKVEKAFFSFLPSSSDAVLRDMAEVRNLVSMALEQRSRANIKVRQPLQKLEVKDLELTDEYLEILKDEINVKEIVKNPALEEEIHLNTDLSTDLIEEGKVRDAIRAVQEWRKDQNLNPKDKATYPVPAELQDLFAKHSEEIKKTTNVEF